MMVTVTQVPNRLIRKIWAQAKPLLLKGERYWGKYYSEQDIKEACIKGEMQLWVNIVDKEIKTVLLTSLITYPRAVYLRFHYIGGSHLRVAKNYVYIIENWAKAHGAIGFELLGRPGWAAFVEREKLGSAPIIDSSLWLTGEFGD